MMCTEETGYMVARNTGDNMAAVTHAARYRWFVLIAALLFSTGGAAIKASALTSWQVAGFRSGVGAIVLYAALPGARRGWTWRTLLIGAAYAATLILFVLANKTTTSANAIFLQSTAPLYLLLLGPLLLHEPVRAVDFAVIAVVAGGAVLLVFGGQSSAVTAPDPARGNLMALAAGFTWALSIAGLRWMGKRSNSIDQSGATVIAGNLIAFAVCLPMAWPLTHASASDAAVILYLGVFQVALAYVLLTRSLTEVPGLEAATLLLLEPVFNPIWTWVIHGERASVSAVWGGLLIITAAFAGTAWRLKFTQISQITDITPPN
jgi:drug/metabolite transporter, DME family